MRCRERSVGLPVKIVVIRLVIARDQDCIVLRGPGSILLSVVKTVQLSIGEMQGGDVPVAEVVVRHCDTSRGGTMTNIDGLGKDLGGREDGKWTIFASGDS